MILVVVVGLLFLLLASGLWIGVAIGIVGIVMYMFFIGGGLGVLGVMQFNVLNDFIWTAMPLFIFMGAVVMRSGVGEKLYKAATPLVGIFPGGLLHTNIAACSIFAASSGSSLATAATIGSIAVPELRKRRYDKRLVLGSLAAGGTLGILIPPSLCFIVYGAWVGESVGKLFMAGVFPGIMLAGLFMGYIAIVSILRPERTPGRENINLHAMASGTVGLLPIGVLVFLVLGLIYLGVATPTEAAAIGSSGALCIAAIERRLNWQVLKEVTVDTVKINSMIVLCIVGTRIMAMALANLKIPATIATLASSAGVSTGLVFVMVVILYLILGCFIDAVSMTLLTLPVTYPLMMSLGFDSVWFGVIVTILAEAALITPPVGMNLFIIQGVSKEDLFDVIMGTLPFLSLLIAEVAILYFFPSIATWLPSQMVQPF